ncbi:MAG: DNA mismatch repair endonuclease MutL [Ruminococcaceae bacterium]|nr:DNA mismatch repair endonuclease MutL [Oscillospiraceae bacterium]
MARIKTLSPHLADLIAAGEVVERPGSVIKELVENSIDAGANSVTIEIKNGGMTYIRVTDNGCGMSPEDAETAFLRHATSKLTSEHELEAIQTLGFRGEALAATSAVSKIELVTREQGAEMGTRLVLEGGTVVERGPVGCPQGTSMTVRDLFFNTPARLKFMKTDRAEGSFVTSVAMRIALSRPDVSIRYIKDGKEEFHTPGDNRQDSCIYSLMGRDFALNLIPAATDDGTVRVEGYVSAPKDARGSRSSQFFFVNGRCVKSKLLQTALEQAYKNNLFQGRFPSCVLYIQMSPGLVDVNVHPAKTEVKFLRERQVFDGVYYATLSALGGAGEAPVMEISPGTQAVIKSAPAPEPKPASFSGFAKAPSDRGVSYGGFAKALAKPKDDYFKTIPAKAETSRTKSYLTMDFDTEPQQTVFNDFSAGTNEYIKITPPTPRAEYTFIGEAMNTYIIIQQGEELLFIDKHAAHERMIFDRLQAGKGEVMSQPLLEPWICRMSGSDVETILENLPLLEPLGYEIDAFGGDSIAIRAVPADTDAGDLTAHMEELAGVLSTSGRQGLEAAREEVLHSVACKAAIKAGKPSTKEELTLLADKVVAGEIKYCPHGRPVAVIFTKYELDRKFKRT